MTKGQFIKIMIAGVCAGMGVGLLQDATYEMGQDSGRKSLINDMKAKLTRFETDEYGRPKCGTVVIGKHEDGTIGYFSAKENKNESEEES